MSNYTDEDFSPDAIPGDVELGPDGNRYRLDWQGKWTRYSRGGWSEGKIELEEEEACAPEPPPRSVPAEIDHSPWTEGPDDVVCFYDGEYQAVIDEVGPQQRRDGWTAERRVLFLERLAEGGSISRAAAAAKVTRQAVYKLRERAPAFDAAFRQIMRATADLLGETAFDRAVHGTERPIFYRGRQVGTRIVHHDRLLMYLLRSRDPAAYAPLQDAGSWAKQPVIEATASAPPPELVEEAPTTVQPELETNEPPPCQHRQLSESKGPSASQDQRGRITPVDLSERDELGAEVHVLDPVDQPADDFGQGEAALLLEPHVPVPEAGLVDLPPRELHQGEVAVVAADPLVGPFQRVARPFQHLQEAAPAHEQQAA